MAGTLVDVRSGFMTLELAGGKVLSFPAEDARTEEVCRAGLARGAVVITLEMRDEVPMKVLRIEPNGGLDPSPRR